VSLRDAPSVGRAWEIAEFWPGVFAFGLELVFDGREGTEELLDDVSKGGGFFDGDAVLREEQKDFAEDAFHVLGSVDLGAIAEERWGEIGGCGIFQVKAGMRWAVGGRRVCDVEAAAAACGRAMLAAR
jgi:hypothetical protein